MRGIYLFRYVDDVSTKRFSITSVSKKHWHGDMTWETFTNVLRTKYGVEGSVTIVGKGEHFEEDASLTLWDLLEEESLLLKVSPSRTSEEQ